MRLCNGFEIVNIADEHMVVPIGKNAESFNGLVVLNDAAAFLLENMKEDVSTDDLISLLIEQYDVDRDRACKDITKLIDSLFNMGLISE